MSKTISSMMLPEQVDLSSFNADLESQSVRVDSEILHPIASSDTGTNGFLKFVIENKGIMSPKSRIQFCGTAGTSYSDNSAYYPLLVGGMSVIKSARLSVGNRTIATSNSFHNFYSTQRGLIRPCKRLGYESVTKLTNDNYDVVPSNAAYGSAVNNGVGVYTGEVDYSGTNHYDSTFNSFSSIGATPNTSPTFSVSLEELFPFLADNLDLPLFLLKPNEQVILHIDLQDDTKVGQRSVRDAGNSGYEPTLLHLPDCIMIVDFIYFNQDRMEQIESSYRVNGDMVEYVDLQLVEQSVDNLSADTLNTQKIILTGTNRVVKGLFCSYQQNTNNNSRNYVNNVLGEYFSENLPTQRGFNLTINNQQLLVATPSDMTTSQNYYYYSTWNGNIPSYIPKPLYDVGNTQMSDNLINGIANSHLRGRNSPFGISFGNSGYAINNVPIQMTFTRQTTDTPTNNRLYVWVLVRRIFSINSNGSVSVSY